MQLEDLSDASFLCKLLVLPTNVRIDWKVIARCKHSSLLCLIVSDKGRKFYHIDTWFQCQLKFFSLLLTLRQNKLECLSSVLAEHLTHLNGRFQPFPEMIDQVQKVKGTNTLVYL
jgi:hypothetical protein